MKNEMSTYIILTKRYEHEDLSGNATQLFLNQFMTPIRRHFQLRYGSQNEQEITLLRGNICVTNNLPVCVLKNI